MIKKAYKWIKKKGSMLYVPEWMTNQDGYIYLPHRRKAFRRDASWANWDEQSEDTLSVDQDNDGVEDTYICFFENPTAGGNETGRGVVTGSDLVLTQEGNVAGATGSPPYRTMDGSDDGFYPTDAWLNALFAGQTEWTLIIKCYMDSADIAYLVDFEDTDARININNDTSSSPGNLRFGLTDTDNAFETKLASNDISTQDDQVCYLCVWTSAIDGVSRGGWCAAGAGSGANGQPTKWSDFATGDRVEFTGLFDNFATYSSPVHNRIFGLSGSDYTQGRLYYVIGAKTCLIDNSA